MEFPGTDRFEVRRRLGHGGMGVVYEVLDRERGAAVALKTLHNLDARALYRFKAEFRSLADVAHPNLVRLGELFGDGSTWYFTMELIHGEDFLTWVRGGTRGPAAAAGTVDTAVATAPRVPRPPRLAADARAVTEPPPLPPPPPLPAASRASPPGYDERRLRAAARQLAEGIAAVHAAQKVHRDIKPTNVMVTPAGRVVLLDFGLATDADRPDRLDSGLSVVGTATYMAPEQAHASAVGPEADWYALGCMLYEALTGRPPFGGTALEMLVHKQSYEPAPPRSIVPDVPPDLDALCVALLRRAPRDRPPAAEILERLGAAPAPGAVRALASSPSIHDSQPFVGRARELASLHAALGEAERGLPISMFVLGESGMGKSSLVRRFIDQLEEDRRDVLVLAGRCYERESVPFKAFDDVVDALAAHLTRSFDDAERGLPADVSPLVRVFPVLRRVPQLSHIAIQHVPDPQELRVRAFAALRGLLVRLARIRPVVVFVDDFQWADADSLALFSSVMHGLEAPPLLFVATVRAAPDDVAAGRLPAALRSVENVPGDLRTLSVLGLPLDEALRLAERLLGPGGASADDVRAIVDEAAGHPLFIQELVRHVDGAAAGGRADVLLDDALWARIGAIEPAARRLLEVAAVAGEPLAARVAMQAAALDAAELGRIVNLLRVASLVRTGGARGGDVVECYHDRIREAVVARLDPATTRAHHEALANALERAGGPHHDAQAVVRHLEAAGLVERAADQAVRAARNAAESLAFGRAAAMYELALRLGNPPEAMARALRIEMADALVNAGRGTDAADAYLVAAEGADAATRLECRRKAAGHLLITGDIVRGLATLEGVLAEFDEKLPATPKRALTSLLWNRARLRLRGTRFRARDESEISPRDLVLIDIYHSVGVGLSLVDTIRGADFQARGLRLALEVGEPRRVVRGIALDAGILASQGKRGNARALRRLDRCAEIVGDAGDDPYLQGWIVGGRGLAHYLGGRFTRGAEMLLQAETPLRADTRGNIWEFNTVRVFRLFSLRQLGRWREMRRELAEHLRDAARRGDRYAETTLVRGVNIQWLITDEPARARRELELATWTPPQGGYHMQHWYELRARIELALYEQDLATARALLRGGFAPLEASLLQRAQTLRTDAIWLRGRAALYSAAAGDKDDLVHAVDAVRRLRREQLPYCEAWLTLLEAGIAAQRGDQAGCRAALLAAETRAEAADLRMCAAAARLALGDVRGEEAMAEEGVKSPRRMAAVLLPGVPLPS